MQPSHHRLMPQLEFVGQIELKFEFHLVSLKKLSLILFFEEKNGFGIVSLKKIKFYFVPLKKNVPTMWPLDIV